MKKIAISVLTKGYPDYKSYDTLISRNNLIYNNIILKSTMSYDMVIFHEGNITDDQQQYVQSKTKYPLLFRNVKKYANQSAFNDSRNQINNELCPPTELSTTFPLGYKHMCHFWSIDFYEYLSDYRYVLRIDEDCFVDRIDPKVLEDVVSQEVKFAVPLICDSLDHPHVIVGLDNLLFSFLKENQLELPISYNEIRSPNTNFMILDMDYFRNNQLVQGFLSEIDRCHGIYSNRWGDAPIWGIILYALAGTDFYEMSDVGYLHGSHNHYVNPKKGNYEF